MTRCDFDDLYRAAGLDVTMSEGEAARFAGPQPREHPRFDSLDLLERLDRALDSWRGHPAHLRYVTRLERAAEYLMRRVLRAAQRGVA